TPSCLTGRSTSCSACRLRLCRPVNQPKKPPRPIRLRTLITAQAPSLYFPPAFPLTQNNVKIPLICAVIIII
ncbi:hypothetical protein SJZ79_24500, partial [Serratia marcescens]|uniref:hypothetical protein n=1 Tax=Serratia marcescens TaxID=615 RepID=UPI0029D9BD92